MEKLGLIAGNGRFPFLLLDAARAHGLQVVVAAIKEETDAEMNARAAADPSVRVHWLSLGELSRLIETFKAEGVTILLAEQNLHFAARVADRTVTFERGRIGPGP